MKAIVAEIDKKQMIVITDTGDFVKIKRQMSAAIGDEIEFNARRTYLTYKMLAPIAACFMACIFLTTGVYAYYTPYSYVSVDINPSIAMSLNRFERVIAVDAITEDAVEFIEGTEGLKNQKIDDALSKIIKSASEKGYIDEKAENQVMLVVSAKDPEKEDKLAGQVNKTASKELAKVNGNSEVTVEKTSVESYKAAVTNKVSPGKEILAARLREVNPEIKEEEVQNMSVKDAVELIKEGKKAVHALKKDDKQSEKETDKEGKEAFQDKMNRNKENENKAAKAGVEDKKDNKGHESKQPSAALKDNKTASESKDNAKIMENSKDTKGNKDEKQDKKPDKDKDKDKDSDKDTDKDKDKDRDEKADDGNKGPKNKLNLKDKFNGQNSEELEQLIEDMMKAIKDKKSH